MATIDDIKKASESVRDATEVGENTATKVGGVFCDMADLIGSVMNDVEALQTETLAVLDITSDYTALDFGLSSDNDKVENFKTYSAIKEGLYLLKHTESSHIDIAPETDNYMIAGVMFVIKDGMKHCLQELIVTNELITTSSGTAHVDNYMPVKFRAWQNYNSPHTPKNAWSKWRDYVSTLFEQEQIEKNVINGNTLIDESISGEKLKSKTIGSEHLKDNSVIQQTIEDEAISTPKIQDNAVTIDKLDADLQQTINEVPKLSELKESFTTQSLEVGVYGSGDLYTMIDGGSIGVSKDQQLDVFELNAISAFFGNIEIAFGAKNPNINWFYYGEDEDRSIYISATEFSLALESANLDERVITSITAEEITTPKLSITGGTSDQILTASGELATRITDDDIEKLFT